MRGIGAILGYLLAGLGVAGCATTSRYRKEEDPCPGTLECSCAEGTGWIPGLPYHQDDRYVQIGTRRIDRQKELFSVKHSHREEYTYYETVRRPGQIYKDKRGKTRRLPDEVERVPQVGSKYEYMLTTYAPKTDFKFKLGSDEPKNPSQFNKQTQFLTETILTSLMGNFSCTRGPYSNMTIYVVGHADRLGDDQYNKELSERRARKVAEGVMGWLTQHAVQLTQPVTVQYLGIGEEEARKNLEMDEKGNEKQRRVDVMISSFGAPTVGYWRTLTVVHPAPPSTSPPSPPVADTPPGENKNPYWD